MAPQLTIAEMRSAVEVAHRAGKPVCAHAHSVPAIVEAVEAGVETIEHGTYLDEATADRMAGVNVVFSPTLSVYPRIVEAADTGIAPDYFARNARPMLEPHRRAF
jgi:imidazolonepropionase-like amidohydrolase